MDLERLRKIRIARGNFIRELLARTDEASSDEFQAILNAVERNWEDINTINRQIVENVFRTDIEKEIKESEAESLKIAISLQKLRISQSAEGNATEPGPPREQSAEGNSTVPGAPREGAEGNATEPGAPREQGAEGNSTEPGAPLEETYYIGDRISIGSVNTGDLICFIDGKGNPQCGYPLNFGRADKSVVTKDGKSKSIPKSVQNVWHSISIRMPDFDENIVKTKAKEMLERGA